MRRINKYLWLIASAAFCSCQSYNADDHKFGNVVYLDVAETTDVQTATIKNTLDELDRTFSATLAYPSGGDVTVSIAVDPSLVDTYNARHNTSWPMLDAKYYSLSDERVTIPAGKTASDAVTLHLQELLGEGEDQTGALTLDATYLLPVTITNASVPTLDSSSTVWYVIKRSSNKRTVRIHSCNAWHIQNNGDGSPDFLPIVLQRPPMATAWLFYIRPATSFRCHFPCTAPCLRAGYRATCLRYGIPGGFCG